MFVRVIAFDCFGTVFNASELPRESVKAYVNHVIANPTAATKFEFGPEWFKLPAHEDAAPGIRKLRENGFICVALSNGTKELIDHLSKAAGIEWDLVIDLAKHGVYKPYSDAYKTVQKETGVRPENSLMVTANPDFGDIEGAMSIGMGTQVIRNDTLCSEPDIIHLASRMGRCRYADRKLTNE